MNTSEKQEAQELVGLISGSTTLTLLLQSIGRGRETNSCLQQPSLTEETQMCHGQQRLYQPYKEFA